MSQANPLLDLPTLQALHAQLGAILRSAGGKSAPEGARYVASLADAVFVWIGGFLTLHADGNLSAARLMVRPCLEAVFKATAVSANLDHLYRIAHAEHMDEAKMLPPGSKEAIDHAAQLPGLRAFILSIRPGDPLDQRKFPADQMAAAGGLDASYYQVHYRLFSKYTHVALRYLARAEDELGDQAALIALCGCASEMHRLMENYGV